MKKPKIYLDTSVINGLFAYDALAQKSITQQLFELIKFKKYQSYVSSLVIDEIGGTKDPFKKTSLLDVILDYRLISLPLTKESENLAQKYLRQKVWTEKHKEDAEHIAIAVANNLDMVLSWDTDDIVKETKIQQVNKINKQSGYKNIQACTPREVI
ncbi:MAG: PIN domain nuclease [Actinobacteria bacterium]|nr:PIN domain nuclease [Actinomycetota bacterium]